MNAPRGGVFSEDARQIVHIAMVAFAPLLRYLTWWEAAIFAACAVAFNLTLFRKVTGNRLTRPHDAARIVSPGIVLYPTSVLLLILMFPDRLDIVAAAWGIMAVGDGMSTIVGRRLGQRKWGWNRDKSIAGSVALFVFGGAAGAALAWWCRPALIPPPYAWFSLGVPFIAALAAAAIETIPINLDDNLSVPLSAAAVLWAGSLVNEELAVAAISSGALTLLIAIAVNVAVAAGGYAARTVSISGAVCGAIIGTVIFYCAGWQGWTLLLLAFLSASLTSRMGLGRKTLLGIAEERGGRRGAGNAIANTGIAAAAAVLSILTYAPDAALLAFCAALVAGASDTVASEIGKAWGRHTWLVVPFTRVPPGTPGAISLEGTAAGIVGAALLAAIAASLGLMPWSALVAVIVAATIGSFVESALAATLEAPGVLNNDALNFLNTAIAAFAAVALVRGLG